MLVKKNYDKERNEAIFDLITQGTILSDGQLYHIKLNNISTVIKFSHSKLLVILVRETN